MSDYIDIRTLRIGNILSYKGKFVHVTLLTSDIDDEYQEQIGFCELGKSSNERSDWNRALAADLSPVPLTSNLLYSMGWITLDAEIDIVVWGLNDDSNGEEFSINSDGLDFPEPLYFDYDLGYREVRKEVKYLHDLQNLYFAITGDELKIMGL